MTGRRLAQTQMAVVATRSGFAARNYGAGLSEMVRGASASSICAIVNGGICRMRRHASSSLHEAPTGSPSAHLDDILNSFRAPIRFAIAYGSGVYRQQGYPPASDTHKNNASNNNNNSNAQQPMVDFIFGVTHPEHWHSLNIKQNRHHYSSIAGLGSGAVSAIQNSFGAGIYFNPDAHIAGLRVKYGVIEMERLIQDLRGWETLYVSGRMQKPVKVLRDDARIRLASKINIYNAVRVSLLMLPQRFTEEELFLKIAGLSYQSDFRMMFGENPYKIYNIVYAQMDAFHEMYKPVIEDLPIVNYLPDGSLMQEDNLKMRANMIQQLPKKILERIQNHHAWYLSRISQLGVDRSGPQFFLSIAESPELPLYVEKALGEIVSLPAIIQSAKGILTAGISRSITYASEKIQKMSSAKKPPTAT